MKNTNVESLNKNYKDQLPKQPKDGDNRITNLDNPTANQIKQVVLNKDKELKKVKDSQNAISSSVTKESDAILTSKTDTSNGVFGLENKYAQQ
jgi:hypothetical protein